MKNSFKQISLKVKKKTKSGRNIYEDYIEEKLFIEEDFENEESDNDNF